MPDRPRPTAAPATREADEELLVRRLPAHLERRGRRPLVVPPLPQPRPPPGTAPAP